MITYLKRVYHRRVRPFLERDISYKLNEKGQGPPIIIFVTNVCYEGCFSCSTKSNIQGNHYIMSPEELDTFLTNIKDYYPEKPVRLSGGEPTTVGREKLWSYANIVKNHGRRLEILTNGNDLLSVNPEIFDRIILDEHISNQQRINQICRHLNETHHRNFIIYPMHHHQDISTLIGGKISSGPTCREWITSVSLKNGVVYPCCILPWLEAWSPTGDITSDLREAGFTYDNKNLPELLENWRETLPDSIYRVCLLNCWRNESQKKARWYPTHEKTRNPIR